MRKYGVQLIVVGGLEKAYYPAAGLANVLSVYAEVQDLVKPPQE